MRFKLAIMVTLWAAQCAHAGVVTAYTDRPTWQASVGPFSTADFTGFPSSTVITTQYSGIGANFVAGFYTVFINPTFQTDGVGLDGNGNITVDFALPMSYIGIDFPGLLLVRLYSNGDLFYTSPLGGGPGAGFFRGYVSSMPFDRIVLSDPGGEAEIDNLSFGPSIPAPGALPLLALAMFGAVQRKRRR